MHQSEGAVVDTPVNAHGRRRGVTPYDIHRFKVISHNSIELFHVVQCCLAEWLIRTAWCST